LALDDDRFREMARAYFYCATSYSLCGLARRRPGFGLRGGKVPVAAYQW
jgi:hypothetical protein